ncbi:MarR family transcriptional regulator [Nocardia bovistercoris]|uniref:Uncharacterized protein n=1 Tax=Nocardia bovistercoris TaxID=2785916 RepID=A0A931IC31_9NOCA|nr:MarR family transcriptional regulator [Nocardia bovistercoris]MBH0777690.1 hypothetical protein [Nocardia bovistercoris]
MSARKNSTTTTRAQRTKPRTTEPNPTAPTTPAATAPVATAPAATVGGGGQDGLAGAGASVAPRTDTEKALWAALDTHPATSADHLAGAAGLSGSTVRRILTAWETGGIVRSDRDPESPRAAKTWTTTGPTTETADRPTADHAPEPIADDTPEPVAGEPTEPEPDSAPTEPAPSPEPDTDTDTAAATVPPESAPVAPTSGDTTPPAPDTAPAGPDPAAGGDETTAAVVVVEKLASGALRGQVEDYLRDHPDQEHTPHQIGKALNRSSGAVHNALAKLTADGTARRTCEAPKRFTLATA